MANVNITVTSGGQRLDSFIATSQGLSRGVVSALIKGGAVLVNTKPAKPSYMVQQGDVVTLNMPPASEPVSYPAPDLPIVYEDEDIIIIDKPAGLSAHPGEGGSHEPTVADFARELVEDEDPERPGIVHRLDKDTSGLLILAKNPAAKTYMQAQFREHKVAKTYQALVLGRPDPAEAIVDLPIARAKADPTRRAVASDGKPATTHYKSIASYPGYTLIEAKPQTGRTHQLRVHLAHLGHPIVGDGRYGGKPLAGLNRQFLHATQLSFIAPSGKKVDLTSPLSTDLAQVISHLENQV